MFAIARIACFSILLMSLAVNYANALMYLDPADKSVWVKGILNDSIPFRAGERIVMERKGVISPWVVALVHLNYEDVREQMEESVRKNFGVAEAHELSTKAEDFKAVDLNVPEDPLFGGGFSGFRELAPEMRATREYTIVSNGFNRIDKIKGYSVSKWRLGDGREILGQPWTIIVVERADVSREWARDHTGMPWPFKISGTTRLVTETEISLIDYLVKQRKGAAVEYFVPYPAYKTGGVLELMKSILDQASAK